MRLSREKSGLRVAIGILEFYIIDESY
jgi:hypothetical protein